MTAESLSDESPILNPVDAERWIREVSSRIARGVAVVTAAERKAKEARRLADLAYARAYKDAEDEPAHQRRYSADIASMPHREARKTPRSLSAMPSGPPGRLRRN